MSEHQLLADLRSLTGRGLDRDAFLEAAARLIQRHYPACNWVGFYFLEDDGKLHVGPYIGKTTPHTVIDLDRGICGAAVSQQQTIVVDDVNADPRYLACSLETRSEIVVPLVVHDEIIGELDIDSAVPAAFGSDEKAVLEAATADIGRHLETF